MRIIIAFIALSYLGQPQSFCQDAGQTTITKKESKPKASPIPIIQVPQEKSASSAEISENPVVIIDNTLTFQVKTIENEELVLRIFDEEGAEVAANKFRSGPGLSTHLLNVNSLVNGTYNFKLIGDNGAEINRELVIARSSAR